MWRDFCAVRSPPYPSFGDLAFVRYFHLLSLRYALKKVFSEPLISIKHEVVGSRGIMSLHPRNILPLFVGRASIVYRVKLLPFVLYHCFFLLTV